MKLIFSRKGFDSASGGVPSPIFPDGRMLSLPIPDQHSPIAYRDLTWHAYNLGEIVSQLTRNRIQPSDGAHLDPDLDPLSYPRHHNWRPCLGQMKAAQGHLRKQQVQAGDLFLFFGLYRPLQAQSPLKFLTKAPLTHVLWGWLQIERLFKIDHCLNSDQPWAGYHPHFHRAKDDSNTLYVAKKNLEWPGVKRHSRPGAGVFGSYHPSLQLTDPNAGRPSLWRLPTWMFPQDGRVPLSYHNKIERWRLESNYAQLNSVGRGQEFVLDCDDYPEAIAWFNALLDPL